MTLASVEFHQLALQEYDEACEWYRARSEQALQSFKISVLDAVNRIAGSSETLPKFSGKYYWARVQRFPYMLVFRHRRANHVVIVAVAHTSRRPGYWRRRS